jgi:two-component system, sensor histidine kinase PhcS
MNHSKFQSSYEEKNRRDYIAAATLGTMVSIPLQLSCSVMDYFMYYGLDHGRLWWLFLKIRIAVAALTALVWFWFNSRRPCHRRIFGITWFTGPLLMVLWMIYAANDPISPYYAGLNIILLAMGLISPWTYKQNLIITLFTLAMYVVVAYLITGQQINYVINNTTFLFLTAAFVIIGSATSSRQRYHEFSLRFELDKNKQDLEATNRNLEVFNTRLADQNQALAKANQDIREAEMQLVQSEKLASLGRFSAGLMHDVLNPLNYAKTGTFTLRKKAQKLPPEMKAEFEAILTDVDDGLKRVDNLVSDLRTFTHPGGQAAEDADVADVLNMALRFVSSELTEKNVRVETDVAPGQMAWISRNHLILVLVNLTENAIDAFDEKKFPAGETACIRITGTVENGRSFLCVRDNGPGIAPEHLSKVFDPFYTTKDVGKGTGLGLSICFGIVRGYSGVITVVSEPGKFCEFKLELPCSLADVTVADHAD